MTTLKGAMLERGYTNRDFKAVEKFARCLHRDDRALWDVMVERDPHLLLHCMNTAHERDCADMQVVWKLFFLAVAIVGDEGVLQ